MRMLFAALLILVSACVAEVRPYPPPPRIMPAQEAVNIATQYARSRGVVIDYTRDVRLDRYARWHVVLGGAGGRDRAMALLDGYSGQVLSARLLPRGEFLPPPPPPPAPPPPGGRGGGGGGAGGRAGPGLRGWGA